MQETLQGNQDTHSAKKEIRLTGFLVPTPEGTWCLANTPAAKSCCLNKETISLPLIDFIWEGPSPRSPVHLTGELSETTEGIVLYNVSLESSPTSPFGWENIAVFALFLITGWVGVLWYKNRVEE